MSAPTGSHLIDGKWVAGSAGGAGFTAVNPATGQMIAPTYHDAGTTDVEAAVAAALRAFEATRSLPPRWPVALLEALTEKIMAMGDALLERVETETALPRPRTTGERGRTCFQLKQLADFVRDGSWVEATIDRADPARQPLPKPDLRRMLQPLGPVVVFDASNFPLAYGVLGNDTASALAAGNPVIVKVHPSHPGSAELLAQAALAALEACNLPRGLIQVLFGRGNDLGAALAKHPGVEAIGFTGSLRGGRALFDLAAARPRPIPVYAEMGSLNPVVLLPGALTERGDAIADGLSKSVSLGGGQFCTKPGIVMLIDGPASDAFVATLHRHLSAVPPVNMLNLSLRDGFARATDRIAATPGVKATLSRQTPGYAGSTAALYETTGKAWREQEGLREEAFGPGTVVVRCKDADDLDAALRSAPGSLTGAVHVGAADKQTDVQRVMRSLARFAGRVIVNGFPTGVEVTHAMVHGGPYPATTAPATTSVGTLSIRRFARPVAYQDTPDQFLPPELKDSNPLGIDRHVDGKPTRDPLSSR
ncbi:MAG: aldehyde dehydrogenase (NADP(+)) [Planctomycetes bacterium]|nr:aldehyde dehydrogenase (NADP(+)) [Planctomycetota bacterium]